MYLTKKQVKLFLRPDVFKETISELEIGIRKNRSVCMRCTAMVACLGRKKEKNERMKKKS